MIIWLASYPRSGNTLFRILLNTFFEIKTYSVYDTDIENPKIDLRIVSEFIGHTQRSTSIEEMAADSEVYIVKTHDMPQDDYPAIYIIRDGRDALVSYVNHILNFDQDSIAEGANDDFRKKLENIITDNASFGGWGPNVMAWAQRAAPTVIVKFETLVLDSNPFDIVEQALAAVKYRHSDAELVENNSPPTFAELHKIRPEFFRKGKIGGWRTEMPTDLQDLFWSEYEDAMIVMGYHK